MKTESLSTVSRHVMLAALLAGGGLLIGSAYATATDAGSDKPRCEARSGQPMKGDHQAKRAAHFSALKDKLQLAPGQEAAWSAFTQTMQARPRPDGMAPKAMRENFAKLSTPQRLDRVQAMAERHQVRMTERAAAVKAFYAQLTPAQQQVFDVEAMPQGWHGRPHRHHRNPQA